MTIFHFDASMRSMCSQCSRSSSNMSSENSSHGIESSKYVDLCRSGKPCKRLKWATLAAAKLWAADCTCANTRAQCIADFQTGFSAETACVPAVVSVKPTTAGCRGARTPLSASINVWASKFSSELMDVYAVPLMPSALQQHLAHISWGPLRR